MATAATPKIAFNKKQRKDATVDILNHVTEVLWFFFEENEEDLEDDAAMDEFVGYLWNISIACMSAAGMKVIGQDEDGSYVATFNPVKSVKELLINEDIADEDMNFYEDNVAEGEGERVFPHHEKRLLGD